MVRTVSWLRRQHHAHDALDKEVTFSYLDDLLKGSSSQPTRAPVRTPAPPISTTTTPVARGVLGDINSSTQQMRVRFEYDGFSELRKLVRLTNATEKITAYVYDELDRTISVKDPLHQRQRSPDRHRARPFCTQFAVTSARVVQRTQSIGGNAGVRLRSTRTPGARKSEPGCPLFLAWCELREPSWPAGDRFFSMTNSIRWSSRL